MRTAFIAGAGSARKVRERREEEGAIYVGPVTDSRTHSSGRRHRLQVIHERDEAIRRKRTATRTPLQRIYYEVFRPALQFVFRQHSAAIDANGHVVQRHYYLLKDVLPLRKRIKYQTWYELRIKCRETLLPCKT
ncbi:MAG: hypothetical protein RMI91_09885 [Gemmatales bacterium]|nr:hypothetical protein [Gemmatales bacterium]MDW7994950.1 hypothetical protein [Gemmatales bacterium]